MKFLIVGLGSIGQRHVRNIRRLYGSTVEISAYRVRKLHQTFSDSMQVLDGVDVENQYNIRCFDSFDDALADKPNAVFITNITSNHMKYALKAAEAGIDLFIEKPLSDSMEGVDQLKALSDKNGIIVYMGYQNRFHPCIKKLQDVLDSGILGKILTVDAGFCERLTTMHRYEDYKTTYMAQKSMGGGCLLNLQIHDIDYLQWIFGMPKSLYSDMEIGAALDTDVEESAVLHYRADKLGYDVMVTTRSDFFQYPPSHICTVVGDKGRFEFDFNEASTRLYVGDEPVREETYSDFQRNNMFIEELRDFVSCIENRRVPASSLDEGIRGLKVVTDAKSYRGDYKL